jgi:hypothetical protein
MFTSVIHINDVYSSQFDADVKLSTHRHANAYAALVLEGGYQDLA